MESLKMMYTTYPLARLPKNAQIAAVFGTYQNQRVEVLYSYEAFDIQPPVPGAGTKMLCVHILGTLGSISVTRAEVKSISVMTRRQGSD
jgi:hypothetical protein